MMPLYKNVWLWLFLLLFLSALPLAIAKEKVGTHSRPKDGAISPKKQMSDHTDALRELMLQLYEIHPASLAKVTPVSAREMTEWVFDNKFGWQFDAIRKQQREQALALLLDNTYEGDYVLPLVVGLETLLYSAYGAQNEFNIPHESNPTLLSQAVCDLEAFRFNLQTAKNRTESLKLKEFLDRQQTEQMINQSLQNMTRRIRQLNQLQHRCDAPNP